MNTVLQFCQRFDTNGHSEEVVNKNKVGAGKKLTCLDPKFLKIGHRGAELQRYKVLEKSGDDSDFV